MYDLRSMSSLTEGISLAEALDTLWDDETSQELPGETARRLSQPAAVLLVAWDAATIAGPRRGRLRVDRNAFEVRDEGDFLLRRGEVIASDSRQDALLDVLDLGLAARVDGVEAMRVHHTAATLLEAAQTLRDHSDSMFLRPPEMRDATLSALADQWSVSRLQVDQWVRWLPALLEHLTP
jgi:hypothetical protein